MYLTVSSVFSSDNLPITGLHQMLKNIALRHATAQVFNNEANAPVVGEQNSVKAHAFAPTERPQSTDGGPKTVYRFRHHESFLFYLR